MKGQEMEVTEPPAKGLRTRVHELLDGPPEGHVDRALVQYGIMALIILSTTALILETVPSIGEASPRLFEWIEAVTIAIFTVEYGLRFWSCSASPKYRDGLHGRLRFLRSPFALADLIAIVPFYLTMIPMQLTFLRVLRLLRLTRLAKLTRYSGALQLLGRVVAAKRYELSMTLFVGGLLLIAAGSLMYIVEHAAQPELFSSIPASMWWAIATLTTVGYGDLAPVTAFGRIVGSFIAVLGIGMFALPTGILGAAFVEEMRNRSSAAIGCCPTCGRVWERGK
jgi:voltage-gated potassium channel